MHKLPAEKLVIFLYNPFHRPLIVQLLRRIEPSLQAISRELYIIYYKPVWADVFDASTALERRFAGQFPYDQSEIGYGPDVSIVSPGLRVEMTQHRCASARSSQFGDA